MDALKKVVAGGGGLRKTELNDEEKEKRGIETSFAEEQKLKLKKKEVQELVEDAPKVWVKEETKFIDTLHDAFMIDNAILNIVFQVIDNDNIEWKDAKKLVTKPISDTNLAKALLVSGLNVKYQIEDGNQSNREYLAIECPPDLPRGIVLKTIQSVLGANGVGDGPKVQGAVVGWTPKNKPKLQVGSLW